MKKFSYHRPKNLDQGITLLERHGETAVLLAGGTDLLVELKNRVKVPRHVIDLKAMAFLEGIAGSAAEGLTLGPLTTLAELSASPLLRNGLEVLAQAAERVGSLQVRNRATIGGNICHASPSGDTLPALLCLNARMKIKGKTGVREVPMQCFFTGPGECNLRPGEILTAILLPPLPEGMRGVYKKFSLRNSMDLAIAGVAALGAFDPAGGKFREIRLGLGAVAPTPIRASRAEEILTAGPLDEARIAQAAQAASMEAAPISDLRASAWYRREMIRRLTEEAVREISNFEIRTPNLY